MTKKPMLAKGLWGVKMQKISRGGTRLDHNRSLSFRCLFRNLVSIYYRSEPEQVLISTTFQLKKY